jgi:hypothetical protein
VREAGELAAGKRLPTHEGSQDSRTRLSKLTKARLLTVTQKRRSVADERRNLDRGGNHAALYRDGKSQGKER